MQESAQILAILIADQPGSQVMSIYAQKLDEDKNAIWNDGEPLLLHNSVPFYIRPQLVRDGDGGAYISWYTTDLKGFVQHLDAGGQLLMPEGGAPLVASGPNLQIDPEIQFSPDRNELYIFWMDTDERQSFRGLSGQKMSPEGELLWSDEDLNFVEMSRTELGMIRPRLSGENIVVFYAQGDVSEDLKNWDGNLEVVAEPYFQHALPLAGFSVIEAESIDEVVKLVSNTPCARAKGVIEIRPFWNAGDDAA